MELSAATMSVFCPHPALGFQKTGRFFVLNAVSASNTTGGSGNNTAESVSDNAAGSGPGSAIAVRIQALADEIRAMKAQKAPKDDVMAKVAAMVALKADYEKATGVAYAAPSSSSGSASGGGGKGGKKTGKKEEKGTDTRASPATPEDPAEAARLAAKFDAIRSVGEECVTEDDLRVLLKKKPDSFRLYDGFEPSGRMHIAQGVFKAINVNKCTGAGGTFVFWVADWFALMNDKMGGDLEKIKDVGQYFVEVWKAAGMDMSSGKVEFRWCSDDINRNADKYWPQMLDIARRFTLARIKKCCTIMGRAEGNLTAAQILYPVMQCTDIFFLRADICQLGVDQRKVNMLAREYCTAAGIKLKPVILSHHMLHGLLEGQEKMSKSDPDSAIFMEDTREDIARKMAKAYCPRKANASAASAASSEMHLVADDLQNPCLDYVQHIVLGRPGATFTVPTSGQTFTDYASFKAAFLAGSVTEADLKAGLVDAIDALVAPVREHFANNADAKALFARVQGYKAEEKAAKEAAKKETAGGAAAKGGGEEKRLRRLARFNPSDAVHLVVAPLPLAAMPSLGTVLTLLKRVRQQSKTNSVVLWLPDWSALVLSCLGGDVKAIRASYTLLVEAMIAVDEMTAARGARGGPMVPTMADVQVVFQSEAILANPSDYWISVINVGRLLKLPQVQAGYLPGAGREQGTLEAGGAAAAAAAAADGPSEAAGCVVSALMHVADVLACAPSTVACGGSSSSGSAEDDSAPHRLALQYWELAGVEKRNALVPPKLAPCAAVSTRLGVDAQQQQQGGGGLDAEDYFVGDDPKAGANKKMKRAFCEPGNVNVNPPLTIARDVIVAFLGGLELNGRTFTSNDWADAEAAFATDELTPQVLKPAVTAAMAELLDAINTRIKKIPAAKAADKLLKDYVKKQSKKKK